MMMLMAAEISKELSESKKTMLKQLLRCVTTVSSIFQYCFVNMPVFVFYYALLCLYAQACYYARNYTSIIRQGLNCVARPTAVFPTMCFCACVNYARLAEPSPLNPRRLRALVLRGYSAEREESTFFIFSVFSSYLHHTIGYGQKQHMTVILNLY